MRPYLDAAGLFLIALIAVIFLGRKWLDNQARDEVYNAPKIPMVNCPKHGLIPKDSVLITTAAAIGRADLEVEHCPICFGERFENVKKQLEGVQ